MRRFFVTTASILISTAMANAQMEEGMQMSTSEGMSGNMPGMDMGMQMPPVTAEMIGESGMRRLVFYANRAVAALEKVLENVDSEDALEQNKINNRFRSTVPPLRGCLMREPAPSWSLSRLPFSLWQP